MSLQSTRNAYATRRAGCSGHSGFKKLPRQYGAFYTMRKTLFSILPLVVFLGPNYASLSSFFGLSLAPSTARVEADRLRTSANPAAERMRARVQKARRVLEKLPAATNETLDTVTLAVGDADGDVRTLTVSKEEFLKKGNTLALPSSDGELLKLTVVRPNYVNTAVRVSDAEGRELQPLAVRYPVEKGGALKEVAYYTSAHPSVESPEIVRAGRDYVHEKLNAAAARLAAKGERPLRRRAHRPQALHERGAGPPLRGGPRALRAQLRRHLPLLR
jgi:hypothetical protein